MAISRWYLTPLTPSGSIPGHRTPRCGCGLGPLSDVPGALRSLDVVVNASAAEPFGLSVFEAQASGVAVIGTAAEAHHGRASRADAVAAMYRSVVKERS